MSSHQVPHETKVVVRGSGRGFAQEISARSHRFCRGRTDSQRRH